MLNYLVDKKATECITAIKNIHNAKNTTVAEL